MKKIKTPNQNQLSLDFSFSQPYSERQKNSIKIETKKRLTKTTAYHKGN